MNKKSETLKIPYIYFRSVKIKFYAYGLCKYLVELSVEAFEVKIFSETQNIKNRGCLLLIFYKFSNTFIQKECQLKRRNYGGKRL